MLFQHTLHESARGMGAAVSCFNTAVFAVHVLKQHATNAVSPYHSIGKIYTHFITAGKHHSCQKQVVCGPVIHVQSTWKDL